MLANWIEAIGTVAAALIALVVYLSETRRRRKDDDARRRTLHAIMVPHICLAVEDLGDVADDLITARDQPTRWLELDIGETDRLIEIQAHLLNFGSELDADAAYFLEATNQISKQIVQTKNEANEQSLPGTAITRAHHEETLKLYNYGRSILGRYAKLPLPSPVLALLLNRLKVGLKKPPPEGSWFWEGSCAQVNESRPAQPCCRPRVVDGSDSPH